MGSGYVYSDKYISDDDALLQFKKHIKRGDELEYKQIKMRTGMHKRTWIKNVCAIGLSAGFIEPLESNGLYSVHEFLLSLVSTLQREYVSQWDRDIYNSGVRTNFIGFMEFVALHFALSHRDDTEYWRDIMNRQYSKNLVEHIPSWHRGFVEIAAQKLHEHHFKQEGGTHCIAAGLHWFPTDLPTIQAYNYNADMDVWKDIWQFTINNMNERKKEWANIVKKAPKLLDFLKTIHN